MILAVVFGFLAYHLTSAEQKPIAKIAEPRAKILVVPGHDEINYGAKFKNIIEEKINLELAEKIVQGLDTSHIEVLSIRNSDGYLPEFETYFSENQAEIIQYRNDHREKTAIMIENEEYEINQTIAHNYAPKDVSLRLYAINKWATEQDFDLILHVHFNDYPGRKKNSVGKYKGFAIYVPEKQLPNSDESLTFAEILKNNLQRHIPVSNLPLEKQGIVEDQTLIAVGANHTLNIPALLVEYGYIYEDVDLDAMAKSTAEAILSFIKSR